MQEEISTQYFPSFRQLPVCTHSCSGWMHDGSNRGESTFPNFLFPLTIPTHPKPPLGPHLVPGVIKRLQGHLLQFKRLLD